MWNGEIATDARSLVYAAMAWYLTEAVGIAFLVPLMLRWQRYRRRHSWREVLWFSMMTALTVGLCAASATKSSFVLVLLTGLPALLVLIRSGIAAAFAEMAVGSALVLGSTFAGYGPFAASLEEPGQAMISAQVFVLGAFTMVVMAAAALEDRMRLAALEDASHKAYELIAELTGDVVIAVDKEATSCTARRMATRFSTCPLARSPSHSGSSRSIRTTAPPGSASPSRRSPVLLRRSASAAATGRGAGTWCTAAALPRG